jgi:hypothetical protein
MMLTAKRDVGRWSTPSRPARLWAVLGVIVAAVIVVTAVIVVVLADDGADSPLASSNRGSGVSVTDHRDVAPFAGVELAGANTVVIEVGGSLAVAVTGDDNLVDQVTTVVEDGRLVIDNIGSFTTNASMSVAVSTPALDTVELAGAGTMTVDGIADDDFSAELTGDGTLAASGTVDRLATTLAGTGTLDLHNLVATDATAQLQGTGTIRVHATTTLDATLSGTGTIVYRGDPTVTMHDTGTGTVVPE